MVQQRLIWHGLRQVGLTVSGEHGLQIWDIAAGFLIVREAGGFVSDFASRDKALETGDVVAANPTLHAELLKTLRS